MSKTLNKSHDSLKLPDISKNYGDSNKFINLRNLR